MKADAIQKLYYRHIKHLIDNYWKEINATLIVTLEYYS